jgi:aryl-alcohol dehydrogenase-like predicted oxidoreductase
MDNTSPEHIERRRLGNSELEITAIGLGAWAIGGEWMFGWGPQDDGESIATIRRAIDRGINWIDTAAAYGLSHSEVVIGRALRDVPPGDRPYVFTKCTLVWDEQGTVSHNICPASLRREAEASLRRLETDCIDLYQMHWPVWGFSPAGHDSGSLEEAWDTLVALQREGKVRHIGICNADTDQLARTHRIAPVTSVQPPYSIVRREIEERTLPFCQQHGIGVIVYSPMQSGLLTGKMTRERLAALPETDWRRKGKYFQEPLLTTALNVVERLKEIAARHGRTPGEIAIAWTLRHPAVTAAIVGARRPDQLDDIANAGTFRLSPEDIAEIDYALD